MVVAFGSPANLQQTKYIVGGLLEASLLIEQHALPHI